MADISGKAIYILSRDCKKQGGIRTGFVYLDLTGSVIYSHPRLARILDPHLFATLRSPHFTQTQPDKQRNREMHGHYPTNFSCEIYIRAQPEAQVMMRIQSFYIPSNRPMCDKNYFYAFDSSTPYFRAMAEVGGEKGLCGDRYPKDPVLTTQPVMTIVFRSTALEISEGRREPGFKITLTAINKANSFGLCGDNQFHCGQYPKHLLSMPFQYPSSRLQTGALQRNKRQFNHNPWYSNGTKNKQNSRVQHTLNEYGYCISDSLKCDSLVHCHNGRDELPSLRIESSRLPTYLLRALVGASLFPSDLNNAGCKQYIIPTISNEFNSSQVTERLRTIAVNPSSGSKDLFQSVKNILQNSEDTQYSASNALIIGCIGIAGFITIVFICSCYQCFYRRHTTGGLHSWSRATPRVLLLPTGYQLVETTTTIPMDSTNGQLGWIQSTSQRTILDNGPHTKGIIGDGGVTVVTRSTTRSTLTSILESIPQTMNHKEANHDLCNLPILKTSENNCTSANRDYKEVKNVKSGGQSQNHKIAFKKHEVQRYSPHKYPPWGEKPRLHFTPNQRLFVSTCSPEKTEMRNSKSLDEIKHRNFDGHLPDHRSISHLTNDSDQHCKRSVSFERNHEHLEHGVWGEKGSIQYTSSSTPPPPAPYPMHSKQAPVQCWIDGRTIGIPYCLCPNQRAQHSNDFADDKIYENMLQAFSIAKKRGNRYQSNESRLNVRRPLRRFHHQINNINSRHHSGGKQRVTFMTTPIHLDSPRSQMSRVERREKIHRLVKYRHHRKQDERTERNKRTVYENRERKIKQRMKHNSQALVLSSENVEYEKIFDDEAEHNHVSEVAMNPIIGQQVYPHNDIVKSFSVSNLHPEQNAH